MSDTATFPFDTAQAPDDETPTGPDRRKLMMFVVAGAVVTAVVAFILFSVVFGGGGSTALPLNSGATPAPAAGGGTAASAAPTPQAVAAGSNRNPFVPLVVAAPSAAPKASPAPVVPAPAASSSTTGQTAFKLLSVSGNQAIASVDGVSYPVSVGQVFAVSYKLTATSGGSCADFTHAGKKLSLCEGQTLLF